MGGLMVDTGPGAPRRPDDIRHTPVGGLPRATPREGTPVQPPGAPSHRAHQHAPSSSRPPPPKRRPASGERPRPPTPASPNQAASRRPSTYRSPAPHNLPTSRPHGPTANRRLATDQRRHTARRPVPDRRLAPIRQPVRPRRCLAVNRPVADRWVGKVWWSVRGWGVHGRGGVQPGSAEWAGVPEAQDAYSERAERRFSTGPMGVRETSGVQVRLGAREQEQEQERERRARRRAGRRSGLVAAGVLVLAGLVTVGLLLTPGSGDDDGGTGAVQ